MEIRAEFIKEIDMKRMYELYVKRLIDIISSLILLIILFPLLLIVYIILIFLNKGDGVLFYQQRVGYKCRIFNIIKYRTMNSMKDEKGELLPDEKRITNIGKFIRVLSVDELPQLINVLKGDMSIIGPRPLLVQYLPLYTKEQNRRHDVRPGITGWAQVNGRNKLNWSDKFKLDVWYVDNISFMVDVKIITRTFIKVFTHKDISYNGEETMHFFNGFN